MTGPDSESAGTGPGAADAPAASRPRAGRESIDADQRVSVNLAASGGRAVDRTDA